MLTVGSLFTGIGGFDLSFENAGFKIAYQVENNPFCNKVLNKHWSSVPRFGDIKTLDPHNLPHVDVLTAGFPCQPFSYAGKRKGMNDERWLWGYIDTIINVTCPDYIFLENVPGFITISGGGAFREILRTLSRSGYDAQWDHLYASDAGAFHQRKRFCLVAYRNSQRMEGFFSQTLQRQPGFSWNENVRGLEDLRDRPDIPKPLIWGASDGIPDWMDRLMAIGNAVVPPVIDVLAKRLYQIITEVNL